jgi:hypothetical protein
MFFGADIELIILNKNANKSRAGNKLTICRCIADTRIYLHIRPYRAGVAGPFGPSLWLRAPK